MNISHDCPFSKHNHPEISDKKILTWIRKRISPLCWGSGDVHKSEIRMHTSKKEILRSYRSLAMGGRPHFLGPMRNELFMHHFSGQKIAYFQGNGQASCPETLALLDIDCHDHGSFEGATEFVQWLVSNGFPGLFWSRSTNGRGIHAYLRIDKRNESEEALDDGLRLLERWLRAQLRLHRWDVQAVEVKGRPLVREWGAGKYELVDVQMGNLAKIPVEALDRPGELIGTTLLTVKDMRRLGSEASRLRQASILAGSDTGRGHAPDRDDLGGPQGEEGASNNSIPSIYCVTLSDESEGDLFGSVDEEELRSVTWTPSMRDGEWPKWVMHVATEGLQESDKLGEIIHELAKWLLWVELFHEHDRVEQAVDLLTTWVTNKHNGHVSRLADRNGLKQVTEQIRRAVRLAQDIREGKILFSDLRRRREGGQYSTVFMIAPLLAGREEEQTNNNTPSIYCIPLSDAILPDEIENQLVQIARSNKMRRTSGGEYPFVIFARRLLNGLHLSGGQARIGQDQLNEMSGRNKADQQVAYKALLRDSGLIQDWEGTYRYRAARSLYRLSDEAKEIMIRSQAKMIA